MKEGPPRTTPPRYYPALALLVAQLVVVSGLVGSLAAVVSAPGRPGRS